MKILFLSNLEYEGFAGPTYCVPALISAVSKIDNVIWYNFQNVTREEWRTLPFYRDPSDFAFGIKTFCRNYWRPDLIVFEGFYAFHPNATLLHVLSSGIPYVIEPHCALTTGDQGKKALKKRVCNALFYTHFARGAAAIHYLTKKERDESGQRWNSSFFIEPNGIAVPDEIPNRETWHGDTPENVFVGRIEPYQKGLDILFDALELIKSRSGALRFHLSIYGNSVDGSAEKLKKRIELEGLAKMVSICEPVFDERKDAVLRSADLFLLTSRYEGMPMGLLEACAYGLPSIVTTGTNMGDVIQDEGAGWVCPVAALSIADAIERAVASADDYSFRSAAARHVAERFSWQAIATSIHNDYCKVVACE